MDGGKTTGDHGLLAGSISDSIWYVVGTKMDDGSNYFTGPQSETESRIADYMEKLFLQGKTEVYLTFPKGTETSWLNADWIAAHLCGPAKNWSVSRHSRNYRIPGAYEEAAIRITGKDFTFISREEGKKLYEAAVQKDETGETLNVGWKKIREYAGQKLQNRVDEFTVIYSAGEDPEVYLYSLWKENRDDRSGDILLVNKEELVHETRCVSYNGKSWQIVTYRPNYYPSTATPANPTALGLDVPVATDFNASPEVSES